MLKPIYVVLVLWVLAISAVQAKTYIGYTYILNELDTKESSQIITLLLQELGNYIRQKITISNDSQGDTYANEDVVAFTAGLTKLKIIEEKWDEDKYYAKVEVKADESRVINTLKEYKKENSKENKRQLETLKENQRKLKESRKEISILRTQLTQANSREKERISVNYADRVLQISLFPNPYIGPPINAQRPTMSSHQLPRASKLERQNFTG